MRRTFLLHHGMPTRYLSFLIQVLGALLLWFTSLPSLSQAQVPSITSSGLNTHVSGPIAVEGKSQFDITGGTRPNGGLNLFHSFGEFGVPTNNIANFLNDTGLPTSNIFGRVSGGNMSNIFGMIQTSNFGDANLFLMNPAGFLFGPNATINVGGMVGFTSADYLKLADNAQFNAIPTAAADAMLTASPVAAFGFLGSNPGAITVQGRQFTVTEGAGISLVGGNITIQSGPLDDGTVQPAQLTARGGQINLASVASPGEIHYPNLQTTPNVNGQSFANMGNITLSQNSLLDVSGDAAGTVRIRSGALVMDNATISADTVDANAASVAVDINITGDLLITHARDVPAITASTTGSGDAGEVRIASANLQATSDFPPIATFALIDAHSFGEGKAGSVYITTGDLKVVGPAPTFMFVDSGPQGAGRGGDATITARNIQLAGTFIGTGTQMAELLGVEATGPAGNLTIMADSLQTNYVILDTHATAALAETHSAGDITLNVRDISMKDSQIYAIGVGRGGAITINANSLGTDSTTFDTENLLGPGGGITVNAHVVELIEGSSFISSTFGDIPAGDIYVTASDHVSFLGHSPVGNPQGIFQPSGIFSNSFGEVGTQGGSGNIFVTTPRLLMVEGRINTITASSGRGGNVNINSGMVSISGEFSTPELAQGTIFDIGPLRPSGIFTSTIGGEFCAGPCGNAGNVSISTDSLSMGFGSHINSGTTNTGRGGMITINATNTISMSGALSNGDPVGVFSRTVGTAPDAGSGGNIALTAGQSFTISNGASVSASSTGPGNAGNIQINAGQSFVATNSSMTTQANQASGGAIKITTTTSGTVQLTNSTISASVLDGTGGGGSVDIDPQVVILQNSQILAQAVQGPGGNISLTTTLFLPDANSVISASSQFGVNGTVTIQSPNAPASGKVQPLGKAPLQATALLNQHCASLAGGEFSSFTVAGRDSLPAGPSSWLASPLALGPAGFSAEPVAEGGTQARVFNPEQETTLLSLRQIAPAGFLTHAFAVDWSVSCQS